MLGLVSLHQDIALLVFHQTIFAYQVAIAYDIHLLCKASCAPWYRV